MKIEAKNKMIAKTLDKMIAGKSTVARYYNEDKSSIDIIKIVDDNTNSMTLSSINLFEDIEEEKNDIQFIIVSDIEYEYALDILIDSIFIVKKNNDSCKPGSIYVCLVNKYYPNSDMEHILLTYPFLWQDINEIEYDGEFINWLQLVPISSNELKFLQENNLNELEQVFENNNIDVFDFHRKSVL